jgi:2-dehydropantoate 2-reductase
LSHWGYSTHFTLDAAMSRLSVVSMTSQWGSEARVAVIGAGAIGGWIAARLALAGQQVSVLARGATLEAIRSRGLQLEQERAILSAELTASADPEELGLQDIVVVAVKAPALAQAAEAAQPLIGAKTLIVPMINGVPWWFLPGERLESVDRDGRIAVALPEGQLVGCVVHASCSRAAPNHVVVKHSDKLILGEPHGGVSDRVRELCAIFEHAGISCEASADLRHAIWYKLWGNATINPLSALTRASTDRLIGDPELRHFALEAMAELAEIGAAIGCPITESGEDRMKVTERLGAFKTSMLQDVEAGRPTELEALLGAPREIAARRNMPTPRLNVLYAMTRLMSESLGLG